MKIVTYITGALSSSLFAIGFALNQLELPGRGICTGISLLLFSLVFIPCVAIYYYKKRQITMRLIISLSGAVSTFLFTLGSMASIIGIKYSNTVIAISLLIFALVFVPNTSIYYYRKTKWKGAVLPDSIIQIWWLLCFWSNWAQSGQLNDQCKHRTDYNYIQLFFNSNKYIYDGSNKWPRHAILALTIRNNAQKLFIDCNPGFHKTTVSFTHTNQLDKSYYSGNRVRIFEQIEIGINRQGIKIRLYHEKQIEKYILI